MVRDGHAMSAVERQYGLSRGKFWYHKTHHHPAGLAGPNPGAQLFLEMVSLQHRTLRLLQQAEEAGQTDVALRAVREVRQNLTLFGRLVELARSAAPTEVVTSAEWLQLRSAILEKLTSHPQARDDVLAGLDALEAHYAPTP